GVSVAVPIRLDHHIDEIGIVERFGGALERFRIKLPMRRPQSPQEPAELAPVCSETGASALRVKVVLIPEPMLLFRRCGKNGSRDIVDIVAALRDEAAYA